MTWHWAATPEERKAQRRGWYEARALRRAEFERQREAHARYLAEDRRMMVEIVNAARDKPQFRWSKAMRDWVCINVSDPDFGDLWVE